MHAILKLILITCFLFLLNRESVVLGQDILIPRKNQPLISLGFFPFINRGVQGCLETEKLFTKTPVFTHGLRLDYQKQKQYYKATSTSVKYNPGLEVLSLAYQVKAYPFMFAKHIPYNGFYLGVDLCYYFKIQKIYRYGPAAGAQIGYQKVIKDKFVVGAELRVTYQQNLNDSVQSLNPKDRYLYNYVYLKFGVKLSRK